jgi:polysaccharide export outer membrane protein
MSSLPKFAFMSAAFVLCAAGIISCAGYQMSNETPTLTFATGPQSYTTTILSDTSLVAVGDSVTLSVWGYQEFGTRTIVKATGTITAPLLGEVMAAGLTKSEFAKVLKEKLAEYIAGEIKMSLEISNPVPRITVLGSVGHQGSFPAVSDMPLLEAISAAGGWLPDSDLRYVKITRQATMEGGHRFIEIDLNAFLESGNARALPAVHPGDVVIIPARENFVRDVGDFFRDAFLIFGVFGLFK